MKVFVVTGCGLPISLGYKICEALKQNSDNYVIGIANPAEFVNAGDHPANEIHYADLSSNSQIDSVCAQILFVHPFIDVLLNVAGYNKLAWFKDLDFEEHDRMMQVNCTAPIRLIHNFLGALSNTEGTVLNIISMGAIRPFRTSLSYNVSKAAFRMATLQLARELTKSHGITVFGISPNDLVGTGMTNQLTQEIADIRGWTLEEAEAYRVAGAVNPRLTHPESLAEFIAFILADKERHHQFSGVELQYGI